MTRSVSPRRPTATAIVELRADCALHMPRLLDVDDLVALLERGTNVVTTRGELFAGGFRLGADRARVLAACDRGSSSVYATGSSPGFITDALPFALLSLQRHVELIEIEEFANLSRRDSPHMLFRQMGFGRPLADFDTSRASYLLAEFQPPLARLAEAAGRPADEWTVRGEVAAARHDTTLVAGEVPAGTVAAQRTVIVGSGGGDPVVRFSANWYCTPDVEPAWDLRRDGLAGARARRRAARRRAPVPRPARRPRRRTPLRTPPTDRSTPSRTCARRRPGS